jgi:LuxR family maltose regulon positive regulatory protein
VIDLPVTIIRSKLYPPPCGADLLARPRLTSLGPAASHAPVTLICAPAGYGKSTLARHWVEELGGRMVWLSLEPADSDLRQFLSYLAAGLDLVFPRAFSAFAEGLSSSALPEPESLLGGLCNAMDALEAPLVIVLDDYHHIGSREVHDFVELLLRRPPRCLQVVITTRRDPPLSLQVLRARGTLAEVRMNQLAFQADESQTFVRGQLGGDFPATAVDTLHERTEGWPVGLRLAVLAASDIRRRNEVLESIPASTHSLRDYLMQEVLDSVPAAMRDYLLRTACLDRLCAPLCETVCASTEPGSASTSGDEFIHWLAESGLFCIPLDSEHRWFRYHHLFQSMLLDEASLVLGSEELRRARLTAATWFEGEQLFEDAVSQLLVVGEYGEVADLIVRHRHPITNDERWHQLHAWLRRLPSAVVESRPELLLLQARWLRTAGSREESQQVLDRAAALVLESSIDEDMHAELEGSLASLSSFLCYMKADSAGAEEQARLALDHLPPESAGERGFAMITLTCAMQMAGDATGAQRALTAAIATASASSDTHPTYVIRLLVARCFVSWMNAELSPLDRSAEEAISLAQSAQLLECQAAARSLRAAAHYHWNDLAMVQRILLPSIRGGAVVSAEFQAQCLIIWSLTEQALGNSAAATASATALHDIARSTQNIFLVDIAAAFAAELAMRQGRLAEATEWASSCDFDPLAPCYAFYSPTMTLAKVLVLGSSPKGRARASALLDGLVDYQNRIHNKRFLAESLALRALHRSRTGDADSGLDDLSRAVALAQRSRFLRLFVDLGPEMVKLLSRLQLDDEGLTYVGEILRAFGDTRIGAELHAQPGSSTALDIGLETLSSREQQILRLLSERLSNKEIADKLHISTVTVKRHVANVFQKLGVHGRRQAVAKADGLGLLQAQH